MLSAFIAAQTDHHNNTLLLLSSPQTGGLAFWLCNKVKLPDTLLELDLLRNELDQPPRPCAQAGGWDRPRITYALGEFSKPPQPVTVISTVSKTLAGGLHPWIPYASSPFSKMPMEYAVVAPASMMTRIPRSCSPHTTFLL